MAKAPSYIPAQDPVRCDLCTGFKEAVKVYCKTCHVRLCQSCISSHVSLEHRSHDMVEFGYRGSSISSTECEIHPGNKCEMRCEQCRIQVCTKCIISGRHKNHDFSDNLQLDGPEDASFRDGPIGNVSQGVSDDEIPPSNTLSNEPTIVLEFDSNNSDLDRISVCGPNEVWTSFMYESLISCLDFTGAVKDNFRVPSDEYAADICVNSEEELYFCDWKQKTVNKYNKRETSLEMDIRFDEWTPRAIFVAGSGDVFVCMTCNHNDQLCKIIQYKDGLIKQEIQNDDDENALFSYKGGEIFLAENRNGDIGVSLPANRSVEVVNRAGKFRFSYHGNLDVRASRGFSPHGIATNRHFHFLIADSDNGCIDCISGDGQFIMHIRCGLVDPRALQSYSGRYTVVRCETMHYENRPCSGVHS